MKQIFLKTFLVLLSPMAFSVPEALKLVTTSVEVRPGFSCPVYLHFPTGPLKGIYFHRAGTGRYSMATMSDAGKKFLIDNQLARLVVDRPGTTWDPSFPDAFTTDDSVYWKTTHSDLIPCTKKALHWAMKRSELSKLPLVLFGHSEGVEIVSKVFAQMLDEKDPVLNSVSALIFSGAPLEAHRRSIEKQLRKQGSQVRTSFYKALKAKNEGFLITNTGLSSTYLEDYLAQESALPSIEKIRSQRPKLRIEFFHGLEDEQCDVTPLMKLERRNKKSDEPANFRMHYYLAGHGLNDAAQDDSQAALLRLLDGKAPTYFSAEK